MMLQTFMLDVPPRLMTQIALSFDGQPASARFDPPVAIERGRRYGLMLDPYEGLLFVALVEVRRPSLSRRRRRRLRGRGEIEHDHRMLTEWVRAYPPLP